MTRTAWLFSLLAFAACRPPSSAAHLDPLDFEALPGTTTFNSETTLAARWQGSLKAHWAAGITGEMAGVDGVTLRYVIHRVSPSKGAVILVPGRTEAMIKFAEVIDDLNAEGYSTYALDVRGQGASDRMLADHDKGYVVSFQDYVTDLAQFVTNVVQKDQPKNTFILAHSMGGAISVLLADQHPELITAMALTAPMLQINAGAFPDSIASTLGFTACSASDGTAFAIGSGDYQEEADFAANSVTSSQPRWEWKRGQLRDAPELRLGGITWRWLCESLTASSHAQSLGRYSSVPVLIMQAEKDQVVKPGGQTRYCGDSPVCQLTVMPGSKHEILQEQDSIRNRALSQVVRFFAARSAP